MVVFKTVLVVFAIKLIKVVAVIIGEDWSAIVDEIVVAAVVAVVVGSKVVVEVWVVIVSLIVSRVDCVVLAGVAPKELKDPLPFSGLKCM